MAAITICSDFGPFRYDLNQIPYDYAGEVRNWFKGLDLTECLMNYGLRFMTLYRRQESRPSLRKKNAKKQNGCLRRPYKYLFFCLYLYYFLFSSSSSMDRLYSYVTSCQRTSVIHLWWIRNLIFIILHFFTIIMNLYVN